MKPKPLFTFLSLMLFLFTSCVPTDDQLAISVYKPLLMNREQLRASVTFGDKRELHNPGKIYYFSNYIFVNERYKGVHVINNSNPESPQNIGFIRVPGCLDMAVKDNLLYVDNAVDLVTIDLSDVTSPKVVSRVNDVFPESLPPDGAELEEKYRMENRPKDAVVVDWIKI